MRGDEIRQLIMGEEWVRAAPAGRPGADADALTHFATLAGEHVWNTFWVRDGLELRLRSAMTIAALVSLDAGDELVAHAAGALRAGLLTPLELREAILHLAPYLGFPRVRHALLRVNGLLQGSSEA